MTCYKLVEIEFIWRLIQGKVERFIGDVSKTILKEAFVTSWLVHND